MNLSTKQKSSHKCRKQTYGLDWEVGININSLLQGLAGGSVVKNPPALQETWVQSLDREEDPGEGNGNRASILAWEIPWTEELGRLQSRGLQGVWCDWAGTHALLYIK